MLGVMTPLHPAASSPGSPALPPSLSIRSLQFSPSFEKKGIWRIRRLSPLLILLLLLVESACAHKRPIDLGPFGLIDDPQIALDSLVERRAQLRSVSGEARLSAKTKQGSGSLGQFVLAQAPDQLRLESISFFGQPVAVLTANGDFFQLHDLEHGRFFIGEATAENVSLLLPVQIPPEELVSLLLGLPPLLTQAKALSIKLDETERVYVLELEGAEASRTGGRNPLKVRQKLGLEPATLRPVWIEMPARWELSSYGVIFSDYESTESRDLPKRITLVSLEDSEQRLELRYREREFDEEIEAEAFVQEVPPGAEILILDRERELDRDGEFNRDAKPDRDGEFERNGQPDRDGEFDRDGESDRDGEFDRNSEPDRDGEFDRSGEL